MHTQRGAKTDHKRRYAFEQRYWLSNQLGGPDCQPHAQTYRKTISKVLRDVVAQKSGKEYGKKSGKQCTDDKKRNLDEQAARGEF